MSALDEGVVMENEVGVAWEGWSSDAPPPVPTPVLLLTVENDWDRKEGREEERRKRRKGTRESHGGRRR